MVEDKDGPNGVPAASQPSLSHGSAAEPVPVSGKAGIANAALFAAFGAFLEALATDGVTHVALQFTRYDGGQHFSAFIHSGRACQHGNADDLARAYESALSSKPFIYVPELAA